MHFVSWNQTIPDICSIGQRSPKQGKSLHMLLQRYHGPCNMSTQHSDMLDSNLVCLKRLVRVKTIVPNIRVGYEEDKTTTKHAIWESRLSR